MGEKPRGADVYVSFYLCSPSIYDYNIPQEWTNGLVLSLGFA